MYVYVRSEPGLWTVGFYGPTGDWNSESDHSSVDAAARRVAYLNGSNASILTELNACREVCADLRRQLARYQSEALQSVLAERQRQDEKWGEQNHDPFTYLVILIEEVGEFAQDALQYRFGKDSGLPGAGSAEENQQHQRDRMKEESIHVAAVALAIVECLDRDKWQWPVIPQ